MECVIFFIPYIKEKDIEIINLEIKTNHWNYLKKNNKKLDNNLMYTFGNLTKNLST